MTEDFLSYIWKYKLFDITDELLEGEPFEIVSIGEMNLNAGPDFINAKIKIGNTLWVGNVEIHREASDWYRHNHDKNAAYDNVILHVVGSNDKPIYTSKGRLVPCLELRYNSKYWRNYNQLLQKDTWTPCIDKISGIDGFTVQAWISTLAVERLADKTDKVNNALQESVNNWEEIFFRQIAHSFGFHVNSMPFEILANQIPYKIIQKHSDNLLQIECLLFGTAGFLSDDYETDEYYKKFKSEYQFLQSKYNLKPLDLHIWKFSRLRPANFPTIRIAQLASLLHSSPSLLHQILANESIAELQKNFTLPVSDYWETHYAFQHQSKKQIKTMGADSANLIILNAIVPFLFVYGRHTGKANLEEKALQFLESLPVENNHIIKNWKEAGLKPKNAFDSQALIHLKNKYCDYKRCLNCRIGIKLINS